MNASPIISAYGQPHQMEPLVPNLRVEHLVEHSRTVVMGASRLQGVLCDETRSAVRELVRLLNAHYSNKIEGDEVEIPLIREALAGRFSAEADVARKQRLAVAHVIADEALEAGAETAVCPMSAMFLRDAHEVLFSQLRLKDRVTPDGRVVEPGELRTNEVVIGRHMPPVAPTLPQFLKRMDEVYPEIQGLDRLLYGIASMHHRATWVHPFEDGNGRAIRLHTQAVLSPLTAGLWSPTRAFGLCRDRYFDYLSNADAPRRGQLDGRGNLSESALFEWCMYFIQTCADEVSLMTRLLEPSALKERIAEMVVARSHTNPFYRSEAILPLQHVAVAGPLRATEFIQLMALGPDVGEQVLQQLVADQLLNEDANRVSVRIPLNTLDMLMPGLVPQGLQAC